MIDSQHKIVTDPGSIDARVAALNRPLVFTNGCFDVLHRGHVTCLEQAAAFGDSLVIGVNTDASVRALGKDPTRPINTTMDRMVLLAALAVVDLVIPFDQPTPLDLIKRVRPEHLVKGGDWETSDIVGGDWVRDRGGQVHSIAFVHPYSTTKLISRIRADEAPG